MEAKHRNNRRWWMRPVDAPRCQCEHPCVGILDFIRKRSKRQPRLKLDMGGEGDLVESIGDFGLELGRETKGNLVYSAFSIFEAWLRVWAGARSECRDEIGAALQLASDEKAVRTALRTLVDLVTTTNENCTVTTANAIWVRPGLRLQPPFEATWGGSTRELDFSDASLAARTVNHWIADRTNDMIRNVVDKNYITPDMAMVLVNAIYLKAKWSEPFDESDTCEQIFRMLSGEEVEVSMMSDRSIYQCAATDEMELLRKPYRGGGFELVVVLPRAGHFDAVRRTLSYSAVLRALATAKGLDTILTLPKFSLQASPQVDALLQRRGATAIYDPSTADLSALSPDALLPKQELFVGKTIHKARIDVDEEGTSAAAATVVEVLCGAISNQTAPYEFMVDRPFLYFVLETSTSLPLFAGHVVDPR